MPSLKRLESKYEDLEEEYEEVRKKLKWFKKERTTKSDSEAKYELYQRVEEYQAKLEEIEEELEELEEKINQSKQIGKSNLEKPQTLDLLYKSLLKLGYWKQHNCFEEIAIKYSHGVFLLQGSSKDDGQKWLLKRLALISPKILQGKKIIIDLNRTSSRTDITGIWNEFAGRVGLPEESLPSKIADKDRKSTRLNSSHLVISYAVFCLKKKINIIIIIKTSITITSPKLLPPYTVNLTPQ